MRKIGFILTVVMFIAIAGCDTIGNDEGKGLQVEEIPASLVSTIEVMSPDNPVIVTIRDTDTVILSIMRNYKNSEEISYSLENGLLLIDVSSPPSTFDFTINPDRQIDMWLEITIPATADITVLSITTDDRDIRLVGLSGTIEAQTQYGDITSSTALSAEVVKNEDGSCTYRGQVGISDYERSISLLSDSGNIIVE